MRIPLSLLFAVILSTETFAAPVAIPDSDGASLAVRAEFEARARKAAVKRPAVKAKPVVKKPAVKKAVAKKTVKKTVAKPAVKKTVAKKPAVKAKAPVKKVAAKPVAKKTTPVKKVAAKPKTTASKKVASKPAAKKATTAKKTSTATSKKVAAKPAAKTTGASKKVPAKTTKPTTTAPKPIPTCPLPKKKTTVRRWLEWAGLISVRADPVDPSCSTTGTTTPTTAADKAAAKAAQKKAKADEKAAKAASKSAAAAAAAASAEAAKRPVGAVANAPSRAVQCTNNSGALTEIPLSSINTAVRLAQAGPLIGGKNPAKFPHAFNNREGVKVAAACVGKTLEEHAVGVSMATFRNVPSVIATEAFNQFRVIITTPDATGKTTFCGVMTHGTSTTGTFEKDLCAEV